MVISLFPYANRVEKGKQFVCVNYKRFRTEKGISHMDKDIPFWKGEKSWERFWDWRQFLCPKQHGFLIRIKLSSHPLVNWCLLTFLSVSEALTVLKIKFVDLAFTYTWGKETLDSSEILGLPFPGLSSWRKLEHLLLLISKHWDYFVIFFPQI